MKHFRVVTALAVAALTLKAGFALGQSEKAFSPYVDAAGAISLPKDFREWTFLGSWSIAGDDELRGAGEFHTVYTQPGTIEVYRRTGEFPDGTVLVKELLDTGTGDLTTGRVSWAREVTGWFVMIKDTEGRFPGNGLWGDGWGWALFHADDPARPVTEDYKAECIPCHIPAERDDWVYVRGYPALRK